MEKWGCGDVMQQVLLHPVIINLQSTKVYVFSDSVLCLGKVLQHPECNEAWKNRVAGVRAERSYRDYDDVNGESTEFEWNIFPGFTTLQLCVKDLLSRLGETPESFTGRILFMSMGPSSEKKWYSAENSPYRGRNAVGIRSGHPIFRAAKKCEEFETNQDRSGEPEV